MAFLELTCMLCCSTGFDGVAWGQSRRRCCLAEDSLSGTVLSLPVVHCAAWTALHVRLCRAFSDGQLQKLHEMLWNKQLSLHIRYTQNLTCGAKCLATL